MPLDPTLIAVAALALLGSKKKPETKGAAMDDGLKLVQRANQERAKQWIPIFVAIGVPQLAAEALARWAGIESGGDPYAVSSQGERGLLQCTKTTALKEKALTQGEWDAMANKATSSETHAKIAVKLFQWLWLRAKKHIANPPAALTDEIWYAKLYHQRPVDVRDGKMHGMAPMMAQELATTWKNDAQKMHYLRAANVVAFGNPTP